MRKILIFLLAFNASFAQSKLSNNYNLCNSIFIGELKRTIDEDIQNQFVLRKDLSFANYIDINTKQNTRIEFEDTESLMCVPYQYNLIYELKDKKSNVIERFTVSFFYKFGRLEMDRLGDLKDFFMPHILVMQGKLLSIDAATSIAKCNGLNPTIVELTYDEEKESRIVWLCTEIVKDDKGIDHYKKVIVLKAKNGRVLRTYKEAFM